MFPLLAPAAAMAAPDAGQVAESERAFAAMAQDRGVSAAFRHFAADDAILFAPDPLRAKDYLETAAEPPGSLRWWPVYTGISQSRDLGFSTGPFVSEHDAHIGHGWFFTIWQRQHDGSWRWLLDHGTPTAEASSLAADAPLTALPPGRPAGGRGAKELRDVEERLDRALARDAPAALQAVLADDGRVMRVGPQPAIGRAAFAPALLLGPARIEAHRLGGQVSDAGDLAYSYGRAAWERAGGKAEGHYVRIWQRRSGGWRLIIDELIAKPRQRPPAESPHAPISSGQ